MEKESVFGRTKCFHFFRYLVAHNILKIFFLEKYFLKIRKITSLIKVEKIIFISIIQNSLSLLNSPNIVNYFYINIVDVKSSSTSSCIYFFIF